MSHRRGEHDQSQIGGESSADSSAPVRRCAAGRRGRRVPAGTKVGGRWSVVGSVVGGGGRGPRFGDAQVVAAVGDSVAGPQPDDLGGATWAAVRSAETASRAIRSGPRWAGRRRRPPGPRWPAGRGARRRRRSGAWLQRRDQPGAGQRIHGARCRCGRWAARAVTPCGAAPRQGGGGTPGAEASSACGRSSPAQSARVGGTAASTPRAPGMRAHGPRGWSPGRRCARRRTWWRGCASHGEREGGRGAANAFGGSATRPRRVR